MLALQFSELEIISFKVKAGILKRLQAANASAPRPPPPTAPPPPPEPQPEDASPESLPSIEGVELFGDFPWFADLKLRGRLLQEVRQAHAAEKILVGPPAEEIQRILSRKHGQLLAAGAVLRLGGVHHGGYGESDINYAYRQLSRALHPDKNPGIPEVGAFSTDQNLLASAVLSGCSGAWFLQAAGWSCGGRLNLSKLKGDCKAWAQRHFSSAFFKDLMKKKFLLYSLEGVEASACWV